MGSLQAKRDAFKAQIAELYHLADEAESCAKLLRQQAQTHEQLLLDENLTEAQLDELIAEKPDRTFNPYGGGRVTERLM